MKLTQIVKIESLSPIKDADRIEVARVLGWDCVVRKGLHRVGDLVLFIFPDTLVPKHFLEDNYTGDEKVRLKTVKMRGQFSAGLIVPMSFIQQKYPGNYQEGDDISLIVGVEKYEKPLPANLGGIIKGQYPTHLVPKTDEENYKSNPEAIAELTTIPNEEIVITLKADGSSATFLIDENGEYHVCSRNLSLKEDDKNAFWSVSKKYNMQEVVKSNGRCLAISGELVGPGVQGNPLALSSLELRIFRIRDLDTKLYFSWDEIVDFCQQHNLPTVTEVKRLKASEVDFKNLQQEADCSRYPITNKPCEGFVIRTNKPIWSPSLQKGWSLKIISQPYDQKLK